MQPALIGAIVLVLGPFLAGCGGGSSSRSSSDSPCGLGAAGVGSSGSGDGTALLSWTPPTTRTDGSALTDLAGYCAYYGKSPTGLSLSAKIGNPGQTTHFIDSLESGQWFFGATAYSRDGLESRMSNIVSKTIP